LGTAAELGLKTCLTCENETLIPLRFNSDARWLVRRSSFRQRGVPHTLVILSDVSRALREEERSAWQEAASLNRFMQAYQQFAQMPLLALQKVSVPQLETRIAGLETRVEVKSLPAPVRIPWIVRAHVVKLS
jgi:hypothetical protein